MTIDYTIDEFNRDVQILCDKIKKHCLNVESVYGVPRGGVPLAMALAPRLNLPLVQSPIPFRTLIVDDVIDSGKSRKRWWGYPFACLHKKTYKEPHKPFKSRGTMIVHPEETSEWIHYWWEGDEGDGEDAIVRIIQTIGDDPSRPGLKDTPKRVVQMYDSIFSGYKENADDLIKQFDGEGYDQIVLLKGVEFYSMCEHHMLPFIGKAHLAYIPKDKVVGISKLARLLEVYSRRLQIQERLTNQIADAMMRLLKPRASACIIEARHLCMQMRGVQKQDSIMITSSLKGVFMDDSKAREELMFLIKGTG